MKQGFKSWYRATLLLAIAFFMLSGMSITSKAVEYDKVIELNLINKRTTETKNFMSVLLDTGSDHISNVRTSSKHLKAGIVFTGKQVYVKNCEYIQLYATKKGTYWLYFDTVDSAGNYKSTERAKVIVCSQKDSYKAFKSIKLGKVNILNNLFEDDYTTRDVAVKKGGKIKVKMNKGCKLLDITVDKYVYRPEGTMNSKYDKRYVEHIRESVKNGSKIKLSKVGEYYRRYEMDDGQTLQNYDDIFGYTYLTFTYRDKKGNERKRKITVRSMLK